MHKSENQVTDFIMINPLDKRITLSGDISSQSSEYPTEPLSLAIAQ